MHVLLSSNFSRPEYCWTPCSKFAFLQVGNAQIAGAAGVIVVNNHDDFFMMGADDTYAGPEITIPAIMVSNTTGEAIKASALAAKHAAPLCLAAVNLSLH